jgi:hypothetical protein
MPNKRFQDQLDAGERSRQRRANLAAHPMQLREAAALICAAHTAPAENGHGFALAWRPPNFVEIDGELYWEAWRVLRQFANGQ